MNPFDLISIPLWIGGLALLVHLLLTGRLMRRVDHDSILKTLNEKHTQELAARDDRIAHLVVDRDRWRDTYHEENRGHNITREAMKRLMDDGSAFQALINLMRDQFASGQK